MRIVLSILIIVLAAFALFFGSEFLIPFVAKIRAHFNDASDLLRASSEAPPRSQLLYFVVASLYVFLVYRLRFSEWPADHERPVGYPPKAVRHFTSWLKYQSFGALYGLMAVFALIAAFLSPELFSFAISVFSGNFDQVGSGATPEYYQDLSNLQTRTQSERLLLAIGIVIGFAFIPSAEPICRRWFQKQAAIPTNAELFEGIISDFGRFKPNSEDIEKFMRTHNVQEKHPILFSAELSADVVDQKYLECYPRTEFIFWKFENLSRMQRSGLGAQARLFKEEREELLSDMTRLRQNIFEFEERLRQFLGVELEAIREECKITNSMGTSGEFESSNMPIPTSLLDDVLGKAGNGHSATLNGSNEGNTPYVVSLRTHTGLAEDNSRFIGRLTENVRETESEDSGVSDFDEMTPEVRRKIETLNLQCRQQIEGARRELLAFFNSNLRQLSDEVRRIYARVLKIVVCASLSARVFSTRQAFMEFGFDVVESDQLVLNWNSLIGALLYFVIAIIVFMLGFAGYLDYFESVAFTIGGKGQPMNPDLWIACSLALLVGGVFGGYFASFTLVNRHLRKRGADKKPPKFSNVARLWAALLAWACAVILLWACALFFQDGEILASGSSWTTVSVVFGVLTADTVFRIKGDAEPLTWSGVVVGSLAALLAVVLSLYLHFNGFRAALVPGNWTFDIFAVIAVVALVFGYCLVLRSWKIKHVES